jgi:serine protease Do
LLIETDVPVNPDNPGGPLFNLKREVIGINSMTCSRTGGFQGLSFAIPGDEAIRVKDQIVKTDARITGRRRGWPYYPLLSPRSER